MHMPVEYADNSTATRQLRVYSNEYRDFVVNCDLEEAYAAVDCVETLRKTVPGGCSDGSDHPEQACGGQEDRPGQARGSAEDH